MSPRTSRSLAARIASYLRVAALLALLPTQVPPALAIDAGPARANPFRPALADVGVTATQSDLLLVDLNGNRRVDPGDTLRYTVVIHNASGSDLSGLTFEETLDASTTLVGSPQVGPLANSDSYAARRDTVLTIAAPVGLLKNDTGTPAPTVAARSVTTAAGGTATMSADGGFSYMPPPGYTGIDSFSYSAENPAGSAIGTVTLTVSAVPVAVDDRYPVVQNSARSFPAPGVLANDTGFPPPSVMPFTGVTTAGGAVTIADNGGFSYSPATGFAGVDTFVYTATNSAGSDTATVTLTVGIAPLAQDDPDYVSLFGAPLSVPAGAGVLQNDTLGMPAATVLSFGGGALPGTAASNAAGTTAGFGTGGTFKLNADGSFALTPSTGFTGAFSFGYRISNPFGISDAVATITIQQLPAITSAAAITFTVGITGSFSVTTVGFPTPAITQTGALPTGVMFVDNGDGTGTLSGAPAVGSIGTYPLSFSAGNQAGTSPAQSLTLTIQQGPAIASAAAASFTVGASGIFTVTTTGFPTSTLALTGTLPDALTFVDNGDGTGTLSGTPAVGTGGSYPLVFSAANSVGAGPPQNFTLVVGEPPVITSADAITFTVGMTGSFLIVASGSPTPTITRGGALLPLGLTFTNHGDGTATLSGTPGSGSGGVRNLAFTASNSADTSLPQPFALTIREAPAITSTPSTAFEIGASEIFTVTASGYPTATLAKLGTLPLGITFVDNGNGTGTLSGTPSGPGGAYPLSFSATNAVGTSAPQSFTLIVGSAPAIGSADAVTLTVGILGTFAITTTGFPGAAITLTGALPNGVTFLNNGDGSATLSGLPAVGTAGSYPLTFDASNMFGSSASQSFTLKVQESGLLAHRAQQAAAPIRISIGALPAGKSVTIIFNALIAAALPIGAKQIANQGAISASGFASVLTDDPDLPGAADPTITPLGSPGFLGSRTVYMPLFMYKAGPPLADLVVSEITATGGNLQVTVKNIGQLAATESFWVDAYINPTSAPVRANQLWNAVGSRGATWVVLGSALPLEPGETLTLTVGDSYYRANLSNPGGAIAAGSSLYAQVDSFNANSNNGAVLETHERDAGTYNNILGPLAAP
ncbi:MAG: Ig-like domain-containing protein [Roseiflexaceae bacterium]